MSDWGANLPCTQILGGNWDIYCGGKRCNKYPKPCPIAPSIYLSSRWVGVDPWLISLFWMKPF
jgi:hypothetical protein